MYQINFDSPVHVHFIGIGGISMSGLAEVLLQEGFTISGSDSQRSELTRHLEEKGATVFYGQTADNIKPGIDVVVYTAAIHPDNAEFAAARSADYDNVEIMFMRLAVGAEAYILGQDVIFFGVFGIAVLDV